MQESNRNVGYHAVVHLCRMQKRNRISSPIVVGEKLRRFQCLRLLVHVCKGIFPKYIICFIVIHKGFSRKERSNFSPTFVGPIFHARLVGRVFVILGFGTGDPIQIRSMTQDKDKIPFVSQGCRQRQPVQWHWLAVVSVDVTFPGRNGRLFFIGKNQARSTEVVGLQILVDFLKTRHGPKQMFFECCVVAFGRRRLLLLLTC
mmetsp:Transcript_179/g.348  ORF Transcript_179/g.348 Transcript_179/m.348 type:complete len:202 (+) Transcript_179:665-1270(+)